MTTEHSVYSQRDRERKREREGKGGYMTSDLISFASSPECISWLWCPCIHPRLSLQENRIPHLSVFSWLECWVCDCKRWYTHTLNQKASPVCIRVRRWICRMHSVCCTHMCSGWVWGRRRVSSLVSLFFLSPLCSSLPSLPQLSIATRSAVALTAFVWLCGWLTLISV